MLVTHFKRVFFVVSRSDHAMYSYASLTANVYYEMKKTIKDNVYSRITRCDYIDVFVLWSVFFDCITFTSR